MPERMTRSILIALVALSASGAADEEPDSLASKLKAIGPKFTAYRNALRTVERIKEGEAAMVRLDGLMNQANEAARRAQTRINAFGNPRFLNSVQLEQLQAEYGTLHECQVAAAASKGQIDGLRASLPVGYARQEVIPNRDRAKSAYNGLFPGIIEAADAEANPDDLDRPAIVRKKLGEQIPAGEPLESFMADLKTYMADNEIPSRKPRPGPTVAVAPAAIVEAPGPASLKDGQLYHLTSALQPGRSIDVRNDEAKDRLQMVKTARLSGQSWIFQKAGDGYYRITNQFQPGKSLDIANDGSGETILNPSGGGTGQLWKVVPLGDGTFRIANKKKQQHSLSLTIGGQGPDRPMLSETAAIKGQSWKIAE